SDTRHTNAHADAHSDTRHTNAHADGDRAACRAHGSDLADSTHPDGDSARRTAVVTPGSRTGPPAGATPDRHRQREPASRHRRIRRRRDGPWRGHHIRSCASDTKEVVMVGIVQRLGFWCLVGFLVLIVGALGAAVLAPRLFGISYILVAGGSMEPTIPYGTVAITREVDAARVNVGDIIVYTDPRFRAITTH